MTRVDNWISVEDEMPLVTKNQMSYETDVLSWVKPEEGEGYHAIDRTFTTEDGPKFRTELQWHAKVTHWMELPEPPEVIDE